ncbi:MAG: DNA cytosine methyltransferase [Alphaproteobacteria bacterium]|nr:DNA cytosine methyltransferase [Alphaproteobacteria bacterium]
MLNNQYILMDTKPEIDVVLFCGGGGADTGIEQASQTPVDIAINHDPEAIGMHAANHPQTVHFKEDIFAVHPLVATRGRSVRLLWASPDCTHFSIAKGGTPCSKKIRSLAWVVVKWAKTVHPRMIFLENVKEFQTWGPLGLDNRPDKSRSGETFNRWIAELRGLGYQVEWRVLSACDFGAPTSRKRLFLIARCDGQPIVWPDPTHGDPKSPETRKKKLKPWRSAAEIIDWSIPCPSIFERKKPLSENTLRRIAKGIQKFVINNPKPFIVSIANWSSDSINPADKPLTTVTANPKGGHHALVVPTLIQVNHTGNDHRAQTPDNPLPTLTAKNGHAVAAATLINIGYGDKDGKRVPGLDVPLGTVVSGGKKHALVSAFLARQYGQSVGTAADAPLGTITRIDHSQVVTSHLVKMKGTNIGQSLEAPIQTITAGGLHFGEVRALLVKYYGNEKDGQPINEPLDTIPTKDRFALITVYIGGEPYVIVDIGLRMLQPHELFAAQGFPADYIFDRQADGTPITKTAQVQKCGNAVCPPVAKAIVTANLTKPQIMEKAI